MNLVAPAPAALAAVALFLVPGLVFLALLSRPTRQNLRFDEALYFCFAFGVTTAAWFGLVLAELGQFSLLRAAAAVVALSLAAALLGRGRLAWPFPRWPGFRELAPLFLVFALAFGLQARPSEYIVGGRDPGAYIAAMGLIARTGGIVYQDPTVLSVPTEDYPLFYGEDADRVPFTASRFMGFDLERPSNGRVVPQFFHLFPAFGGFLAAAMGVKGALATPPLFGVLSTLSVFLVFRRLFGVATAGVASLLLGLNVIQVWFARFPVSETMSQFLIFLGLLAFALAEDADSPAFRALAGSAFGLSLLVRVDSLLVLVPLGLFLLIRRADGSLSWRKAAPLSIPLALLTIHAGLHAAWFSHKYILDILNRRYWRQAPAVWLGLIVLGSVVLATAHRWAPLIRDRLASRKRTLTVIAMATIAVLALYAYFLRPQLSAWAGGDGNDPSRVWSDPTLLRALGFRRLAAHDAQAFLRFGWFVTPLGLALGVVGALLLIAKSDRRHLLPLLLSLSFSLFYFYKIRVFNDYYFALRRYLPVTLPFLLGFAAYALVRLAKKGKWPRIVAVATGLVLAGAFTKDTWAIARHVDWRNSVRFVADVARRFGPEDVVIFEKPRSIHLLSLPLWAHHGVNAIELRRFDPDPERLQHLVTAWRKRYRGIYFVHTPRTNLCGLFLRRLEDHGFGTFEWERAYDRPPRGPQAQALHYTVSRVVPPEELQVPSLPEVDVGGSDDFQVSGFFDKEGGGDHSFRWTGACASVFLPGARAGARLTVTASAGNRPASHVATVDVSLSGVPLGRFVAGPDWEEYRFELPAPLPPGPAVLRFDVPAWKPANVWPGDPDVRELGVMVDRIRAEVR